MAVKKTQMYRRNLDGTETNLNPLTESQYVLMDNGQTVQEVLSDRDSDKYTPVITNSSTTFKVGQGDNVDLSSSMKEGAYDSCVLKGKTMVNCIQEPSSKDVVLPYEFADGQYVTINNTKESGALGVELKGQTLVNLVPSSVVVSGGRKLHKDDGSGQIVYTYKPKAPLKPNTVYTCFVWLKDVVNPNSVPLNCSMSNRDFYARPMTNGLNIAVGTTKSELGGENCNIRIANADVIAGARGVLLDAVVVEGDYSSIEINPFYGMASCKLPILHTVGNNLFDLSYYGNLDNLKNTTDAYVSYKKLLKLEPNTRYRILSDSCVLPARMWSVFGVDDKNSKRLVTVYNHSRWEVETENDYGAKDSVFTTPADGLVNFTCYARHRNPDTLLQSFSNEAMFTTTMGNLRLVKDGFSTVHEPYKSSILSLPEEVVLRSLPNGVCDTFNTRTGVYTQRIGEVVLDGRNYTGFSRDSGLENDATCKYFISNFFSQLLDGKGGQNEKVVLNCDGLPSVSFNTMQDKTLATYPCIANSGAGSLNLRVKKDLNSTAQLLTHLQSNPLRIQYELATPIVTKVNLSSTLKSWNTTTHIYSEIQENTLYPILSHSNPSYPVILKPSTKYSIVANSYSNSHTNSAINFNLGGATASTTVGNRVTTITTPSTLSNELLTMSGRGNKLNSVMVIEGDVVGDEPYFEGMCDSKSPILSNVGKNLFDASYVGNYEHWETNTGVAFNNYPYVRIQLKQNTNYVFTRDDTNNPSKTGRRGHIVVHTLEDRGSGEWLYHHESPSVNQKEIKIRTSSSGVLIFANSTCRNQTDLTDMMFGFSRSMIEESSSATTYEPYKSNILSFNQKDDKTIVLRSLPSGVCDTLNVETGEYTRKIGEIIIDGSENWELSANFSSTYNAYYFVSNETFKNNLKFICDKYKISSYSEIGNTIGLAMGTSGDKIAPFITSDKMTLSEFKEYLSKNPTTIQYELATPIVSTIDVQGFPYAYTNGHVQLSSGSIEQSLTPKVEYSLSANKTGQIDSNTRQVVRQQKQLDDFEAMMLTSLVQSAYDKAILQFDYEMQMMSLGGE